MSIFREFYSNEPFIDALKTRPKDAVDVLIPILHTNELWKSNLLSIYREIPVNRLLIGDGGCIDDTLDIVREFPRVVIFDHSDFVSLGYSIRKLIESVETDWFIYLHSDVYLPEGWYDKMMVQRHKHDWLESSQHFAVLVDYPLDYAKVNRSYSGGQLGRRSAFEKVLPLINDDYLYRNEDIIFAELIKQAGFKYGRAGDVHHYHQVMQKRSAWTRRIQSISINMETSHEEEIRACSMQAKGLIKYLEPQKWVIEGVQLNIIRLIELGALDWDEFKQWVTDINPAWWEHVKSIRSAPLKHRFRTFLRAAYHLVFG